MPHLLQQQQQQQPAMPQATAAAAAASQQQQTPPHQFGGGGASMERTLFNLHQRFCICVLERTTASSRASAERLVLFVALCSLASLFVLHSKFVSSSSIVRSTCLTSIPGFSRDANVTHVHLLADPHAASFVVRAVELLPSVVGVSSTTTTSRIPSFQELLLLGNSLASDEANNNYHSTQICNTDNKVEEKDGAAVCTVNTMSETPNNALVLSNKNNNNNSNIVVSFAHHLGDLYFSDAEANHRNLVVQHVYVSPSHEPCFGDSFAQTLVSVVQGTNTVMIHWLIGAYSSNHNDNNIESEHTNNNNNNWNGYIYNHHDPPIDLSSCDRRRHQHSPSSNSNGNSSSSRWTFSSFFSDTKNKKWAFVQGLPVKVAVFVKTNALFFVTTKLISYTLRETQGLMLELITHLRRFHHTNHNENESFIQAITTHVNKNLVFVPGIFGFGICLVAFYKDYFLALVILGLVWVCEALSFVGLRTKQGIQFFPAVFQFWFSLFHYYYLFYPLGFCYLALASAISFILFAILWVWHRYELPAVAMGLVNPDHPRQDPSDATVNPPLTMQHQWQQEHQPEPDAPRENRFSTDENRRNFNRTQSFNTTASGYLSRNSSSNQMYQRGYEYEDDDASSTRYGLGGEVVISRNYTVRVPQRPDETDASAPSMEHQHRLQRHRPRFINELGPVASAISADEDSVRSPPTNIRSPASSHDGNVASDNSSRNANENEPSALQSILNVMNDDDSLAFHSSDPLLSPAETIFRQ